jgi:hypothetical protein
MPNDIWNKLMNLDRRWVYLVIGLATFLPILVTVDTPVQITSEVISVFDRVESLPEGTVIMIPMEYSPDTMAELQPMAKAVLRHCFSRDLKVISTALQIQGVLLIEQDLRTVADEYDKVYGEDYVFLGYKPYPDIVILNMGENFRKPFPLDYYNNDLDDLPMMAGLSNYSSVACIVNID